MDQRAKFKTKQLRNLRNLNCFIIKLAQETSLQNEI